MSAVVVLEWTFSPPNYFEAPIEVSRDDHTLTIVDGKAEARIDSEVFDANPSLRQTLHDALNDRFLGVQVLSHSPYELSRPTMTRVYPDGRRDLFLEAETGRMVIMGHPVDIQIRDTEGKVVVDSKRDRIEKKRAISELASTYCASDETLASLLRSYHAAVRDPNDELVHLYEIREALSAEFGGEEAVRSALGISSSDWSRLGQLCNSDPLRQGRHRGKTRGALRDASEAELTEARGIARAMTEAYLRHLDNTSRNRD